MPLHHTIKRPLVSGKNNLLRENGIYAFEVDPSATKLEIKKAMEKYFRVKVDSVRTSICRGRSKKTRVGVTQVHYWKKAMVKLAQGEKISLFEGA